MSGMSMPGMTMAMSMSDVASGTMSAMPMASTAANSMPASGMAMMAMDSMAMTFFASSTTPLYSMAWTPSSAGQYAGTCIFLIAFATVFRALLAFRVNFFRILAILRHRRTDALEYSYATDAKRATRPWRANEAVMISAMEVVLAGIGYLLMVAVMTMNVGYFLSILAGIFLGSMIFSRFMPNSVGL